MSEAQRLMQHLRRAGDASFLFGMELFNDFFSKWHPDAREQPDAPSSPWRSDCCDVTGMHPAVLGQDFHYYLDTSAVEAEAHRTAARVASEWGCVLTFDYHMKARYPAPNGGTFEFTEENRNLVYNIGEGNDTYSELKWFTERLDRVIDEIRALGRPIVLRPFHEMNGKWFWWGPKAVGGAQSYQKFFRFTVSYIRIRANTDLALFAWSPNFPFDDKAIEYFPGADVVDVIGLDVYDIGKPNSPSWPEFKESVTAMGCFAHKHGKVAAVTETGNRRRSPEQHPSWWWLVRT